MSMDWLRDATVASWWLRWEDLEWPDRGGEALCVRVDSLTGKNLVVQRESDRPIQPNPRRAIIAVSDLDELTCDLHTAVELDRPQLT